MSLIRLDGDLLSDVKTVHLIQLLFHLVATQVQGSLLVFLLIYKVNSRCKISVQIIKFLNEVLVVLEGSDSVIQHLQRS